MRLVSRLVWVLAAVVLAVGGCNEVTAPTTAPLALTVTWRSARDEPLVPLEDAQVCESGTTNCVLTDDRGEVTIGLPFDEEVACAIEKEGYDRLLIPVIVPESGASQKWGWPSVAIQAENHQNVMSPYPRLGTGDIYIALDPPFVGATFKLVGATGRAFYEEPMNPGGYYWTLDLTETTSRGRGGFVEVPPGTFRVEFGGTAEDCVPNMSGWPRDDGIWVPVREGYSSFVAVTCPLPP